MILVEKALISKISGPLKLFVLTVMPDYNSMSLFRLAILRSDAVSGKG